MLDYYLGLEYKWLIDSSNKEKVKQLSKELNISEFVISILLKKGFDNAQEIINFLNISVDNLYDPFLMKDMDIAVERIVKAINNREKILVYGDYDVDGVTSSSILINFFTSQGITIDYYVPDRFDEGYGISNISIEKIVKADYNLMITVDCGITAISQIEYINKNSKIDVIITDHHHCLPNDLPKALAVLNPHRSDCDYPFKELCGAGVAFKLVQALCIRMNLKDEYLNYIDLAAIGTIADIVDVNGENRVIIKYGLDRMNTCPNLGVGELIAVSGCKRGVDTWNVSFGVAPRINAAGRMGDAKRAIQILTCDNLNIIKENVSILDKENTNRQEVQSYIFEEAVKKIESDVSYKNDRFLVIYDEGWHHGIIGIVASKIVEKYNKPCFIISIDKDVGKGSGRSIKGFDLYKAMEHCSDILDKFGGHELAGGISIKKQNIATFKQKLNTYSKDNFDDELYKKKIKIDCSIQGVDINIENVEQINALAPFGQNNSIPNLLCRNLLVKYKKIVGEKHLRLVLFDGNKDIDAIAFNRGDYFEYINIDDYIDVVFKMEINEWQSYKKVQLKIINLRLNEKQIVKNNVMYNALKEYYSVANKEDWFYNIINDGILASKDYKLIREELAIIYKMLKTKGDSTLSVLDIFKYSAQLSLNDSKLNYFKVVMALNIFNELNLIKLTFINSTFKITFNNDIKSTKLDTSVIFRLINESLPC